MQSAVGHWGTKAAYECIGALSGTVFAPALCVGASRSTSWHSCTSDMRIEFMGHALGFTVERPPAMAYRSAAVARTFVDHAAQALSEGAVILCGTWPCWEMATEQDGGVDQLCALRVSREGGERPLPPAARVYVLQNAVHTLTRCEAIREALRFGANVASGAYKQNGHAFGHCFFEAWSEAVSDGRPCPESDDGCLHCAHRTVRRVCRMEFAASGFLDRAKSALEPTLSAKGLTAAARAYEAMGEVLQPYTREGYLQETWRNVDLRGDYAANVDRLSQLHSRAAEGLTTLAARL